MRRPLYLFFVVPLCMLSMLTLVYLFSKKEPLFALRNIKIKGMSQLSEGEIVKRINPFLQESFFGTDVGKVKETVLSHPFVRDVSVKRIFPFSLVIDVKEKIPSALWVRPTGEVSILDERGVAYRGLMRETKGLLVINAPEATDAKSLFKEMNIWLRDGLIQKEWLSEVFYREGNVTIYSAEDGVEIILGKEEQKERMKRAAAVLDDAKKRGVLIKCIDARFEKGAIIREGNR
jgi:cell division protein FtsQ